MFLNSKFTSVWILWFLHFISLRRQSCWKLVGELLWQFGNHLKTVFWVDVILRTVVWEKFWQGISWYCAWSWENIWGKLDIILAQTAAASIVCLNQWWTASVLTTTFSLWWVVIQCVTSAQKNAKTFLYLKSCVLRTIH